MGLRLGLLMAVTTLLSLGCKGPDPESVVIGAARSAERVLLADTKWANFERRGGKLYLFLSAEVFAAKQSCSASCVLIWELRPQTFCWQIEGTTATTSTECQQRADLRPARPRIT